MTKMSDNAFPSILITEGTEPSAPAAGKQRLYIDSTTHKLKRTDSSGTDVTIEASGSVATDTIFDAKGDLPVGTGSDTAQKLSVGGNGLALVADSSQTTGLKWGTPTAIGARVYNSGNINLNNGSDTLLTFDSERYDTNTIHDTSSNTSRLTASHTGKWRIGVTLAISASPGNACYSYFKVNGSTIIAVQMIMNDTTVNYVSYSTEYALSATDYVEVFVKVNAGSKVASASANYSPEFYMSLIGS